MAFQQNFINTIGTQLVNSQWGRLTRVVLFVLNSIGLVNDINESHISLIPKIKSPTKVSNFRFISLCNVIYKIISKILVNILKKILPCIILPTQSAFLHGRLILDNIIVVAFEAMQTMNCGMLGKFGYMA